MAEMKELPVRLALRVEGDFWVAYLASAKSMDNAKCLGSILIGAVDSNPERKQAFLDLMQSMIGDAIKDLTGKVPIWGEHQVAPENERAGRV